MKALLISDLHYALKQFDWAVEAAPAYDLVIVAGDHLDIAGQLDGRVQIVVILKYLRRLAACAHVIASSGNHDLDGPGADGEKIASWMGRVRALGIATDGDSVTISDTLFTVCPWWDGPHAKDNVAQLLETDAAKPKRAWHWVYHAPPEDSPTSWTGKRHYGDAELSAWIKRYRPNIVYTGHIHEAPFKPGGSWADRIGDTWVFNSGRQTGPTPTRIAINTNTNEAAWFSLAGAEHVRLDRPREIRVLNAAPAWLTSPVRDRSPA